MVLSSVTLHLFDQAVHHEQDVMQFVVGRLLASFYKQQHQLADLVGNQQFFVRWDWRWIV